MDKVGVLESLEWLLVGGVEPVAGLQTRQSLEALLLDRTLLAYLSLKLEGLSLEVLAG